MSCKPVPLLMSITPDYLFFPGGVGVRLIEKMIGALALPSERYVGISYSSLEMFQKPNVT